MSLFAVHCRDGADGDAGRRRHLDEHLGQLELLYERLRIAGPVLDGERRQCGAMLVIEAEDRPEAESLVASLPYVAKGVWSEVRVEPYCPVIGTWLGGLAWTPRARTEIPCVGRFAPVR